jgi:ribosomal protein L12E/L44/L45/RPP1/RPP2
MLEDFWLPRREGSKGTEITTLQAGQNLGQMEDVQYFQKKLLQSMNVPYSRLEPQGGGLVGIGRSTEVTRDELKFNRFIVKLRNKFAQIFDHALKTQLTLKGICTQEEWEEFRDSIYYEFKKDNNFIEMRNAELLQQRLQLLTAIDPYVGRYYSQEWVKKNVLQLTDDDIEEMEKQIEKEPEPVPLGPDGRPMPPEEEQQPEATPEQYPPEDNVTDRGSAESETPELDSVVKRFGKVINKK